MVQQTGEDWPDVRVTLSTARPSLDAAPPDLLPLKMDVAAATNSGPIEALDDRSQRISGELGKTLDMSFKLDTPLSDIVDYIRRATSGPAFPEGIPIYVDPIGLQDADKTMASTVSIDLHGLPIRTTLRLLLSQIGMVYRVRDGLLTITSASDEFDNSSPVDMSGGMMAGMGGMGGGMGGGMMGGMGMSLELAQASGAAVLNRQAANEQEQELRGRGRTGAGARPSSRRTPRASVSTSRALSASRRVATRSLLEVGRVELPAEYFAKAIPVLTPRAYRLAKLTNTSDFVLLPGEATAYVGGEFVGRMKLPLVAAGEPFTAGFGVDPQVQISRRLIHKARSVQGGNQVFTYEFRIGLRNYRPRPVKVQLWDRLPTPEGEAVMVNLVKTSDEIEHR